jgi:peptidyl-prolyl cis-trans isomerase A (cyclophilin A)
MRAMKFQRSLTTIACLGLGSSLLVASCKDKDQKPETEPAATASAAKQPKPAASERKKPKTDPKAIAERRKALKERMDQKKLQAKPVAKVKVSEGDPENGEFTLEEATQGLGNTGALVADIVTDAGTLSCELYEDKAPITVANFVGLARGKRAFKQDDKWIKKPLYDGTTFHRVIKGFMIQGGDPKGNGSGGPGYVIPDEIWENAKHDKRGLLCMANAGPNTNGSQFFVMDGAAAHLDGGYTIFGLCGPDTVIEKLASTEVKGDRAVTPPKIKKITVKRDKSKPRREAAAAPDATGTASPLPSARALSVPRAASAPKPPVPAPQGT